MGTPASCLRPASLCGTRIQSSALLQHRKGCRKTTVMAAKGVQTERLHQSYHFKNIWCSHHGSANVPEQQMMLCSMMAEPGVSLCSCGVHQACTAGWQGQPSSTCGTCSGCKGAGSCSAGAKPWVLQHSSNREGHPSGVLCRG